MKCNSSPFLEEKNLIQMGLWTVRFIGEDHTGLCSLPGEVLFFLRIVLFRSAHSWQLVCSGSVHSPTRPFIHPASRPASEGILGIFASSSFGG